MNKKGFTLVELLAVVVLMAILVTIAVPGITRVNKGLKTQSFCTKVKVIEAAAADYANDYYKDNTTQSKKTLGYVSLADLINLGYLTTENACSLFGSSGDCIKDPRDDRGMDYDLVSVWTENNRLYSTYLYNNLGTSSDYNTKVCGQNVLYQAASNATARTISNANANISVTFAGKDNWSLEKSFMISRDQSDIFGNYIIDCVVVSYTKDSNAKIKIKIDTIDDKTSGNINTKSDTSNNTSGSRTFYVANSKKSILTVSLSGASKVNNNTLYRAGIDKITVYWKKIS